MPPQIATILFAIGIAGLFRLDRDTSLRTSKGLWLPIIWFSIAASRPISFWLGATPPREIAGQFPEGSSLDQAVAMALMLCGLIALIRRGGRVTNLLKASWPITLYFSFCLLSVTWSDFPAWGSKRWIRSLGDLIMVLVIATEAQPSAALKRLFSRLGFVLLPASVLFIRYYPEWGQRFDDYGLREYTGVTANKNILGDLVYFIGLGVLWQILSLLRDKEDPNRKRRLMAQLILAAIGINLLFSAHCASAVACSIVGAGLMLALSLPFFRRSPRAVHVLVLSLALVGGVGNLLGAKATVTEALGRKPDLTGRTEIWAILLPLVPNPIGGAGFETFWCGPRVAEIFSLIGGLGMTNEAHNGYIDVYLNLGLLGLCLIALILRQGYLKAASVFRNDPGLGGLLVAYVVTAVIFNITEAGFRMLSLSWFFLLLSVVMASRVNSSPTPHRSHAERSRIPTDSTRPLEPPQSWPELDGAFEPSRTT